MDYYDGNQTLNETLDDNPSLDFSLSYRVLATTVHLLIFLLGVIGNTILIAVVFRVKCLQTPTYRYLVRFILPEMI
jgi:hypothetical protein